MYCEKFYYMKFDSQEPFENSGASEIFPFCPNLCLVVIMVYLYTDICVFWSNKYIYFLIRLWCV